jgi:hypothetical protein
MRDLLFGTPVGWQLDVWLALGSIPWWVPATVVLVVRLVADFRAVKRWPDGKP